MKCLETKCGACLGIAVANKARGLGYEAIANNLIKELEDIIRDYPETPCCEMVTDAEQVESLISHWGEIYNVEA